jgi:uncharacterized protein Yka (UPF0111/DUF47 family)
MKTNILAAIGEQQLQPVTSLNAALAANDRVKFRFSLLQMALSHAEHPDQPAATLREERVACGIEDSTLDNAVAGASMVGTACHMTGAAQVMVHIVDDMRTMAAPVLAFRPNGLGTRLDGLLLALPAAANDLLDPAAIGAMTRMGRTHGDSLHQLVMDLHKQLNQMQSELAEEKLDGAAAYNLTEVDRALVLAFMKGLNRTARLKFEHPGLSTTATRIGDKLVIQNDLGTTDAHVIVIHVSGLTVTLTYTDVHAERLAFFQQMFRTQSVIWNQELEPRLSDNEPFYLTTGLAETADEAARAVFLQYLGSRLVFLIDWNRARKQLRGFLRRADRLVLLHWAAEAEIGHRGFLELGGARPINQAIEATAGSSMHLGDRLCDVLGDKESLEFLRFVLRTSTEGLLAGVSRALLHDRIRVALATHFSNEERQLLEFAADHAALIFEMAGLVQGAVQGESQSSEKCSRRAGRYEHDADQIVLKTRDAVHRRPDYSVFLRVLEAADDAADELEDAAFLVKLETLEGKPVETLQNLADCLVEASQEWIKALGHASQIGRSAGAAETEEFLTALDRIHALENHADDAQRTLAAVAIQHARDFRQLHLFAAIGVKLETAADALKRASLILREHVLEDVIDG